MKPLLIVPLLAGLFVVAALTSGSDSKPAEAFPCLPPEIVGDLWGDGNVDSADALWVLGLVAQTVLPEGGGGCSPHDIDCNGGVSSVDALKILRYVADLPYTQHEPCPDIGTVIGGSGLVAQIACLTTVFGDIDGIGSVGPGDAMWILRRIAELPLPEGGDGCSSQDVDCDSDRDAVDALKILRYVADLPYTQHEPCPDIGTDVDSFCAFGHTQSEMANDSGPTPTPPVPVVEFCNDTSQAADGLQFWADTGGYPLHVLAVVSAPGCDTPSVTVTDPPSAFLTWPAACVDPGESVSVRVFGCDNLACTGPSVICFRWTLGGAPITPFPESSADNPC